MSVIERLDRYQQTHPRAGFPLAVVYKFVDDQGGYLAALIAYYGFLSLFPLLLLLVTIVGFALHGDPSARDQITNSALSQFPLLNVQLGAQVQGLHGSKVALVTGILGSAYGGIGVAQAGQHAMNAIWTVPRNRRPNPIRARLKSLLAVVLLGSGIIGTTVLSGLVSSAGSFGLDLGALPRILALTVSLGGNSLLFLAGFRMLTAHNVSFRALVPGALAASVTWQLLQALGTILVGHTLRHASQLYGTFGAVLGLVGFLYITAMTTLLCAEVNVVRARRLWPRALLTPFTDNVELTSADERSYEALATTQQAKGFENIEVTFDGGDDKAESGA